MRTKALQLLQELTEAHSVSGFEDEVRAIFINELENSGELACDKSGNVFCAVNDAKDSPRIIVAGHMDEVGFMVQHISSDGFIQFVPLGGWWEHSLLSQRVEILTKKGKKILGVVASKPPHFLPASQKNQLIPLEQLFIDVGAANKKDIEENFGIQLGDPIAPVSEFTAMSKEDYYMAKAFDNRVGMAAAIQCGQILSGTELDCHLICVGTVQEEVGLRGAKTAAHFVKPDVAIVLEGPPADDSPGFSRAESQGRLGGGVQIRLFDPTAITNPRLAELAIQVAKEEGIAHQVTVRRSGGTDAGSFHIANSGVPTIVLGVPARYIHSHNAIIDINDYLAMVSLATSLVRRLDTATIQELTCFI